MRRKRRLHKLGFKATVALAAIRGELTMAQMDKKFDVQAAQITQLFVQTLTRVFASAIWLSTHCPFKTVSLVLMLFCFNWKLSQAESLFNNEASGLVNTAIARTSPSEQTPKPHEFLLTDEPDSRQWPDVGVTLGFGASYAVFGVKGYIGTPYARAFATFGLGVGAGFDFKLGNAFELGLTRLVTLGGAGWDAASLSYHPRGAYKRGWFVGIEYIGNRTNSRDPELGGTGPDWFGTFGYEF